MNLHHVDQIAFVELIKIKPHVLAYKDSLEVLQIVSRSVLLVLNVDRVLPASIRNALILAMVFVELTPNVE